MPMPSRMDIKWIFVSCALVVVSFARVIHASTTNDIILTSMNSQVTYSFNSSEPVCNSPPDCGTCCTCDVYVSSPSGTILNATFLALQIPSDDTITFTNRNTSEELLSLSGISSLIDPIYSDSSNMKISFKWCDDTTPYSYLEAEFSFLDRFQDPSVKSSGGAFELSDAYPSIAIQSANLSSLNNLEGELHWFITSRNYTWIKIDILVMEPGQGTICIFDTFDTFGEWVCMTDSVSSTTWYSYDDEMRMTFYINQNQQLGVGLTVKLSIIDHSLLTGQSLILPACNPTVIQEDTQTIQFVTPYFNQSLQNVRYQCRMRFTSREAPASVEFKHFDLPAGEVSIYSLESGNRVNLADAQSIQVDISSHSPVISLSPTHEMILDVYKHGYPGDGNGLMMQDYTFDHGSEPIASFGIAVELNDTLSSRSFTTLGYPILPGGVINVRWFINRVLPNTVIKVQFIDFDIGTADLLVEEMDDDSPIYQLTGSSLPDDIYSDTQMLTFVLRSNQPCCTLGFYFNVTLIQDVDYCTNTSCANGGTCIETFDSFSCSCPTGFTGSLCQNLMTTVHATSGLPTQMNTDITTITTPSASTSPESSSSVKSTVDTSPSHTTSRTEPTLSTLRSQPVSDAQQPGDDNNILIIALSISLTIAFGLIAFLVCVVVYRMNKNASVFASNNHPNQQTISNTNAGCCVEEHLPPPPYTPRLNHDYETIEETQDRGSYIELDQNAMRQDGPVGHLRGTSQRGMHQNPPSYTPRAASTVAPASTSNESPYVDMSGKSGSDRVGNRDSEGIYLEPNDPNDIHLNGTSPPPLYDLNILQTTTLHS